MSILVIGAGPAGLATAACLNHAELPFRWVDRQGEVGGAYSQIYGGMTLASPARYSGLPDLPVEVPGEYVTAAEYFAYLRGYASKKQLKPERGMVESIKRMKNEFLVGFSEGAQERYEAVVVATGMFDHPYFPKIDGLDRERASHAHDWPGPGAFRGRKVLIIGGGVSGVELAEELAGQGTPVVVSAKRGKVRTTPQRVFGRDVHDYAVIVERFPRWILGSFCARHPAFPGTDLGFNNFLRDGLIRVLPEVVRGVGQRIHFQNGLLEEFDSIILATGYKFQTPFLGPEVERSPAGVPRSCCLESRSWPGLYFMGFPCARGLDSEFLRGMARDAHVLARLIKERLA